ncbi:hypothetical protein LJC15_02785 [Desulfovibrio sp. OttesenSCG-928-G11]|nr:hypothetical protein [Desulfovibrio sp. OttesenSCG-928-G11]
MRCLPLSAGKISSVDIRDLLIETTLGRANVLYENAPSATVAREHKILPAALPAGTAYAVPSYIVGSGKLEIFYDGVLAEPGVGEMYQEAGSAGAASTSIIFNVNLPAGADLTAIAAS